MARLASAKPWRRRGGQTGMYFTYILKSLVAKKTYTGHTDNFDKRLSEHNSGKSLFTKRYKPWEIIYLDTFNNLEEAIKKRKIF